MNDYYAGFDMGTDSVGWAVTDPDYNLCKFKGNAMWGIRLFMKAILPKRGGAFAPQGEEPKEKGNALNGCKCFLIQRLLRKI
jgi:hypothetical protein